MQSNAARHAGRFRTLRPSRADWGVQMDRGEGGSSAISHHERIGACAA